MSGWVITVDWEVRNNLSENVTFVLRPEQLKGPTLVASEGRMFQ